MQLAAPHASSVVSTMGSDERQGLFCTGSTQRSRTSGQANPAQQSFWSSADGTTGANGSAQVLLHDIDLNCSEGSADSLGFDRELSRLHQSVLRVHARSEREGPGGGVSGARGGGGEGRQ
jgi:hypothetical protein